MSTTQNRPKSGPDKKKPVLPDQQLPPKEPGRTPGVDWIIFGVSAALILGFVLWGVIDSEGLGIVTTDVLGWVTGSFGWLFVLSSALFVAFSAFIAFTRYGNIKLGPDDSTPEFSTVSWVAMMFAAGMGIGLMFYGVSEPLTHFNSPPLGLVEAGSPAAAQMAMEYSFFHWGLHPWAMFAVIGLAIAYFAYRKGEGNLISSCFRPLLGNRIRGGPGRTIDIISLFATVFGTATSLGLGALQITGGLGAVFGMEGGGTGAAITVIAVLTLCFILSAISGIEKGIKWLSNGNAIAAGLLVFFLFVVGPTVFILQTFTDSIGGYLTQAPAMSFRTGVFEGAEWLSGWTIFYWAWWISWTPFVGMFIARISRGRTMRQFVIFVIAVPSLVSFIWFSVLGGSALNLQMEQGVDMQAVLAEGSESTLFSTLENFPLATVTSSLAVVLIAIFFITGADSASIVMGMLSQRGTDHPNRMLIVFWGVLTGAVASILLLAGGLEALQRLVIIVALPFMLILIAMVFSLWKALREEPFDATLPPRVRRAVQLAEKSRTSD